MIVVVNPTGWILAYCIYTFGNKKLLFFKHLIYDRTLKIAPVQKLLALYSHARLPKKKNVWLFELVFDGFLILYIALYSTHSFIVVGLF